MWLRPSLGLWNVLLDLVEATAKQDSPHKDPWLRTRTHAFLQTSEAKHRVHLCRYVYIERVTGTQR